MTRKIFFALMILIATVAGAQAQTGTVSGSIIDSDGLPLIGANVVVKGSTTGSITDIDGNFSIASVPVGSQTIIASFIGYNQEEQTITVVAGQTVSIKFTLVEDVTSLDELIVIGYGTQKKEDKTGAVAHIKSDELNGGVLTDPLQALAGKAAGVVVTKGGGDPNSDAKIKIRGSSGISGETDTNPLYVIDGIPGADPNMIAPEDIESYNILKDAASTAIYGSRGANGVIIITTKKGSEGSSNINFNMTSSIDKLSKKLDLYSADDYRATANENFGEGNWTDGGANTDWQDEIFRTGVSQNYNLSASGGSEKGTYYASVTHSDWEGVIKGSGKERTLGKLNISHKGLNDKLTITGSLSAALEQNNLIEYDSYNMENVLYQAYQRNPTDPVYNEDGTVASIPVNGARGFNYINPVGIIENVDKTDLRKKIMGNAKADLEIIEGLVASASFGYINRNKEYKYFRPVGVYGGQGQDNGAASRFYEVHSQKSLEATLNYNKSINDIHNLDLIGGYSWQENGFTNFGANVRNSQSPSVGIDNLESFIDVQYGDVESERNMSRLIGFFGRAQYNFDHKYYVAASLRTDGSSKFGPDEKWGTFPTASLGWNLHRESFIENISAINQLKLRGSYGVSGNQAFDPYYSMMLYKPAQIVVDPVTGNEVLTWTTEQNWNDQLKWEKTTEINVGIDYAFLNSRLNGSIEYYNKTTDDLLNNYSVSQETEYPKDRLWANSGVVINQGFELFLSYFAVDQTNVSWKTSLTLSKNSGKVTDLGRYWTKNDGRQGWLAGDGMVGGDNWTIYIEEDQPLGNFVLYEYGYIALDENDGAYKIYYKNRSKEDENEPDYLHGGEKVEDGNGVLDENDRYIAGNATPDIEIGWTNNFTFYKNWSLDFSFRSLIGQEVYNHTYGYFASPAHMPDRNAMTGSEEYREEGFVGNFLRPADNFMENASFLRLDYISLSYNFPLNDSKYFKNLRLSVSSNNLFVLTNYTGSDPEMTIDGLGYGVDNFNMYPKTRTFSFGLNATF